MSNIEDSPSRSVLWFSKDVYIHFQHQSTILDDQDIGLVMGRRENSYLGGISLVDRIVLISTKDFHSSLKTLFTPPTTETLLGFFVVADNISPNTALQSRFPATFRLFWTAVERVLCGLFGADNESFDDTRVKLEHDLRILKAEVCGVLVTRAPGPIPQIRFQCYGTNSSVSEFEVWALLMQPPPQPFSSHLLSPASLAINPESNTVLASVSTSHLFGRRQVGSFSRILSSRAAPIPATPHPGPALTAPTFESSLASLTSSKIHETRLRVDKLTAPFLEELNALESQLQEYTRIHTEFQDFCANRAPP